MSVARQRITEAAAVMREMIPYFPRSEGAFDVVIECIGEMVQTEEQLRWLTNSACKKMEQFSLPALRAIYESRYDTADSAAGIERARLDRADREYAAKLEQWKREAAALPPPENAEPLPPLPKLKKSPIKLRPQSEFGGDPNKSDREPNVTLKEVQYVAGEGFTIQRERITLQEAEAQLAEDLKNAPQLTPEEKAERAVRLESQVKFRASELQREVEKQKRDGYVH